MDAAAAAAANAAPAATPTPTAASGSGSRITVVCAECKRLKLKCDRRAPCGSCVKRDTVARCLYSAAAAEKIDLQSLHNRILSLEASVQVLVQSGVRRAPTAEYERTVLATGPSGSSSVVVSLEDVASIWLEQLDILKDVDLRVLPPDYSERTKMAFPDMHLFIDPLYPDEGPCVTFKLIHQLPTQSVRDVLLRHLEMTMLMHPSFNFPTFKRRVEALFDPILFSPGSPPTESEKPHVGGAAALAKRPSLAFFAATVGGLALGARVASSSISHSSPTPQSERGETSPPGEASALPYSADALFLLSTQALAVAEFNQNYDLDHISAVLLNGLFLLHDGKQRVAHTIYPTIGKLVNIAKMMGLHIDPDEFPGKYTLYDAECRRRSWWDVYYYDLFMSDCMGQEPLIDDNTCTTRLPADVDEDAFHPGSETLPPPRQESNFAYFRQKCSLAQLIKTMRKRWVAEQPTLEMWMEAAQEFESEVNAWLAELPPPFRMSARPSEEGESPFTIAQRCELAALANSLILKAYIPLLKRSPQRPLQAPSREAALACSTAAHVIVQSSQGLFRAFGHSRPASYVFYSFGRQIFAAAAVAASIVIQTPNALIAQPAMADLKCALDLMRDPFVSGARGHGLQGSAAPSNSLHIVELLHAKAEEAIKQGGPSHLGAKRKHGLLEDIPSGFSLPFVGSSLVTGPMALNNGSGQPISSVNGASPKLRLRSSTLASGKRAGDGSEASGSKTRTSPGTLGSRAPAATNGPPSVQGSRTPRERRPRKSTSMYPSIGIRVRKGPGTAPSVAESQSLSSEASSTHLPPSTGIINGAVSGPGPASESVINNSRPGTAMSGPPPPSGSVPGVVPSSSPFRAPMPLPSSTGDHTRPPQSQSQPPPPTQHVRQESMGSSYDIPSYPAPPSDPSPYPSFPNPRGSYNAAEYGPHPSVASTSSSPGTGFYMAQFSGHMDRSLTNYDQSPSSSHEMVGVTMSGEDLQSHRQAIDAHHQPEQHRPQHSTMMAQGMMPHNHQAPPTHSPIHAYQHPIHTKHSFDSPASVQSERSRDSLPYSAPPSLLTSQRSRYSDVDMKPPMPNFQIDASTNAPGPRSGDSVMGDRSAGAQQQQHQQQQQPRPSPYGPGMQLPSNTVPAPWEQQQQQQPQQPQQQQPQPHQSHHPPQHPQSTAGYEWPRYDY